MENAIFEPQTLPKLPPPGFIEHRILESPLPLALSVLALSLIIFVSLRRTRLAKRIGLPVMSIGILACATIMLIAHLVTTDREQLGIKSHQLIAAAASGDRATLDTLLDEDVRFESKFGSSNGKDRVITLDLTRGAPIIQSASVSKVRVGIYAPRVARTQVRVRVNTEMIPPLSWWSIDWTRPTPDSTDWVVTHIEPLWIQGISNPGGHD